MYLTSHFQMQNLIRVVLNFNFTDDAKTVTREEVLGSSVVDNAPPNKKNPNLFPIGEGFGFFVFFGNENNGSSLTAVCPKPYQKKDRITKVTTVKVP